MNRIVNSIEAKDIENHFHPYTNPQTLKETGPHVICRGEGVYVYDNSNTKFIEGMSGLWCASLGRGRLARCPRHRPKRSPA